MDRGDRLAEDPRPPQGGVAPEKARSGRPRASRLALLLAALLAPACASLFHKPRPDVDLPVEERPWRVRCLWATPPADGEDAAPGPAATGATWAGDSVARRLLLHAHLEDGFLVVTSVEAASDEDDRDVVPYPATRVAVGAACQEGMKRDEASSGGRLYGVRGVRDGEGVEVPLVFSEDADRPRPVSRAVVFGDSLSDDGNLKRRLLVFPSSPYWLGRFSNGPNWVDHLAARTGLAAQNLAYGGAAATRHPDVPAADVVAAVEQGAQFFLTGSLNGQVRDYVERDLATGVVQSPDETVFVIWGGANDYISKEPFTGDIGTLLDTPEGEAGYRRVVDETVQALLDQIRTLHAAGARRFALLNLPNLGFTPIVVHNTSYEPKDAGEASDDDARRIALARKLGELTLHHNRELHRALARAAAELPDATIVPVDAARAFYEMLERISPEDDRYAFDYGFDLDGMRRTLQTPRSRHTVQDRCYSGGYLGTGDASKVCPQVGSALFWDVVHPSSYMHCWVAYFVQRDLANAGWVPPPASADAHRAYCRDAAEAAAPAASGPAAAAEPDGP